MKTEAITFDQLVSGVLLYQGNTNTHMFNDVFKAINIVKLLTNCVRLVNEMMEDIESHS